MNATPLLIARRLLPVAVLLVAAAAADRLATRPQRVEFARRTGELASVRDALLRYENEHGKLPRQIQELVPEYLRQSEIGVAAPLYRYAPDARLVAMAEGLVLHGLWPRRLAPAQLALPPQDPLRLALARRARERPPAAVLTVPAAAEMVRHAPAPAGALVIEAEHWTEMNYGWEIHPQPDSGGGAHIVCKEGTAAGSSQSDHGFFNFYDDLERPEQTVLKYHFHLAQTGRYYIFARLWSTDSHCSNNINVGLDRGGLIPGPDKLYYGRMVGSAVPFRWIWARVNGGAQFLAAGDHFLQVFPHEDGIQVDQFVLSPSPRLDYAAQELPLQANCLPGHGTAFAAAEGAPAHLSFDVRSRVMSASLPADCRLVVRKLRPAAGAATVSVWLQEESTGRRVRTELMRSAVDLGTLPELGYFQLDMRRVDLPRLPRREYLLRAEISRDAAALAGCRLVMMHPLAWEVSDPLPYIDNSQPGPFDGGRAAPTNPPPRWTALADSSWSPLGVIDFGLHTVGNSLHAPEWKTVYARTAIDVPEEGEYLLKLQSDDQMRLWLDGREAGRIDTKRPTTRNALRLPLRMARGRHEVLMRVNQQGETPKLHGGWWQASLRFRTSDDRLCGITGAAP